MEQPPHDDEHERRRRQSLIGLGVAVALLVAFAWLLTAYKHSADELSCIAANHRNCDPVDPSAQ